MKNTNRLAIAFLAVASFLAPMQASALSINDYEKQTPKQRADFYSSTVKDMIHSAYQVDPKLGLAIGKYFTVIPAGHYDPEGAIAFAAEIDRAKQDAKAGKTDLDKIQIEDLLVDVVQVDVVPNLAKKKDTPATKSSANP